MIIVFPKDDLYEYGINNRNLDLFSMDVATTLHSTLFEVKSHCFNKLQNVECVLTLHSPYIRPTLSRIFGVFSACIFDFSVLLRLDVG